MEGARKKKPHTVEGDLDLICRDDLARDNLFVFAEVEGGEVDAQFAERLFRFLLRLFPFVLLRIHLVHDDLCRRGRGRCQPADRGSATFTTAMRRTLKA
jgi:hypothetical protein